MTTQARTSEVAELLGTFLHVNLHARDGEALAVFVDAAVQAAGAGTLDEDAIRWLRHLWQQRTAPTAEAQRAYVDEVFLPTRIAEATALVDSAPGTLLDIGFGDGAVLRALAAHWRLGPAQVIGVETRYTPVVTPAAFHTLIVPPGDGWRIPLPDRCVDLVTMHNVLHHTTTPTADTVLAEAARLVSEHGHVLIREHDVSSPAQAAFLAHVERLFYEVIADETHTAPTEPTYRSLAGWLIAIDRAGLQVVTSVRPPGRSTHLQVDILCRPRV